LKVERRSREMGGEEQGTRRLSEGSAMLIDA
jgi:hypothetical protein